MTERDDFLARWSAVHGGVELQARTVPMWFARTWLGAGHAVARPLANRGVGPDLVTVAGVLVGLAVLIPAAAGGRWALAVAVVAVLAAFFDSLDGAVALLSGRSSRWGAVLDAVADRIADAAFAAALWLLGAPVAVVLVAIGAGMLHEYLRARAGAAGLTEVGVVTISERPTRVVVATMFALAAGIYPAQQQFWASAGAWVAAVVGVIGFVQLAVVVRRRLR